MLKWVERNGVSMAKYPFQGGLFVSIEPTERGWLVTFTVGPRGAYRVPTRAKAMAWVERYVDARPDRDASLGRSAATTGMSFDSGRPHVVHTTPEEQARYDAFTASYVPPKRRARKARR